MLFAMKLFQRIATLAILALLITQPAAMAQEERKEEKETTKVIIIEEKTDQYGNKTVTKTIKEGQFTDEEIERMIEGEGDERGVWHGKRGQDKGFFKSMEPRGYLGVNIEDAEEGGALVLEVVDESPAADASLHEGDVIRAIDGMEIEDADALIDAIGGMKPGATIDVRYVRDGATQTTQATLTGREDVMEFEFSDDFDWDESGEFREKMEKMKEKMKDMHQKMEKMHEKGEWKEDMHLEREFNAAPRPRFGVYIEEDEDGVRVTEVIEGSLAEGAGLQEGDVITEFNGTSASNPDVLIEAVQAVEAGKSVTIRYLRDGKTQKTSVKFAKEDPKK